MRLTNCRADRKYLPMTSDPLHEFSGLYAQAFAKWREGDSHITPHKPLFKPFSGLFIFELPRLLPRSMMR